MEKTETPTPRTDKECDHTDGDYYLSGYVDSDFARQLERELADAQACIRDAEDRFYSETKGYATWLITHSSAIESARQK